MHRSKGMGGVPSSLVGLVVILIGYKVGDSSKPKIPIDVDVEVSSKSIEEEDVEEDLVRFEDTMDAASHAVNTLDDSKLSQNFSK